MNLDGVKDPERLRELLDAVLAIGSDLSLPQVLRNIVETAVKVVDCRYGAIGVLSERHRGLSEFVHVGIDREVAATIGALPEGRGILGLLIVEAEPLRLRDLTAHAASYGFPANHPPMRSLLGVPILVRGQVFGNLYLTMKRGADEFSDDDELLALALAGAAGIAIEKARLHARVRDLTLVEDRERIAADLHDTVIQRLFATGLALQAAVRLVGEPEVAARVEAAVDDLDETILQIRSTIFALQAPRVAGRGVRGEILALATEAAASLRFEPHVRLEGPLDAVVDDHVATQMLAVLREALSNVVRHAAARRVDVTVGVTEHELHARVADDGCGVDSLAPRGRGLVNMEQRALHLGGTTSVERGPDGTGTVLSWRVPLSPPA